MREFFSADGAFYRIMTDLTNIFLLNMVTLLCCIPIVTIGAALSSMHFALMKMNEQETHIVKAYWHAFKTNVKEITPMWLLNLVIILVLAIDVWLGYQSTGALKSLPVVLVVVMALLILFVGVWLYPLRAKFTYSMRDAIVNAFLLSVGNFPRTLGMAVVTIIIPFAFGSTYRLLPLLVMFGISLPAYVCSYLYYPVFKKMMPEEESDESDDGTDDYSEVQ